MSENHRNTDERDPVSAELRALWRALPARDHHILAELWRGADGAPSPITLALMNCSYTVTHDRRK